MNSVTDNYSVGEVSNVSDKNITIQLWHSNLSTFTDFATKYDWLYEYNPFATSLIFHLKSEVEGVSVGVQGISARIFQIGKKTYKAGLVADYAVDKKHRSLGPGLRLLKEANKQSLEIFEFLYGFPNQSAGPVFKRAGYKLASDVNRYSRPIKTFDFLRKRMNSVLALPLAMIIDSMIWLSDLYYKQRVPRNLKGEWCSVFDKRFDVLWELSDISQNILVCRRDSKFLNWRFIQNADKKYHKYILVDYDSGKVVGYVISYIGENNVCYIVDFLALNSNYMIPLFRMFFSANRKYKSRSISIEFKGDEDVIRKLNKLEFKFRGSRSMFYAFSNRSHALSADSSWYITSSDEDSV